MDKLFLSIVGLILVLVVVLIAVAYTEPSLLQFSGSLSSANEGPSMPGLSQLNSLKGDWKIIGTLEDNDSSTVGAQVPNATSVYEEVLANGSTQFIVQIFKLNGTTPNTTGTLVGKYLVIVQTQGNVTPVNTSAIVGLVKNSITNNQGIHVVYPSVLPPSSVQYRVVEFGNGSVNNYSEVFAVVKGANQSIVQVEELSSPVNASSLYHQILQSLNYNVTNGTLEGAQYFNLTQSQFGSTVYNYVGIKGDTVIIVSSQGNPGFDIFAQTVGRLQ